MERARTARRLALRLVVALVVPAAVLLGSLHAEAAPSLVDPFDYANAINGIDVSHWQGPSTGPRWPGAATSSPS